LNHGRIRRHGKQIGFGYPPIFAVKSDTLARETNVTSGAVDLAKIEATAKVTIKVNKARFTKPRL
jgi:hypothetical protein